MSRDGLCHWGLHPHFCQRSKERRDILSACVFFVHLFLWLFVFCLVCLFACFCCFWVFYFLLSSLVFSSSLGVTKRSSWLSPHLTSRCCLPPWIGQSKRASLCSLPEAHSGWAPAVEERNSFRSNYAMSADVFSLPKRNKIYIPPHLKSKLGMVVSLPL